MSSFGSEVGVTTLTQRWGFSVDGRAFAAAVCSDVQGTPIRDGILLG